jgi:hypothetical protein
MRQASLPLFGKVQEVPVSPDKTRPKIKRSFLYLLLQLLEGGLPSPYVKLGYITMDDTDDVWMKVHQTLRRYATGFNDFFFELIPVCKFVNVTSSIYFFVTIIILMLMLNQLFQGSKVETWLLETFSEYRPEVKGLNRMKDGKLKNFLLNRVNNDLETFYTKKTGHKKSRVQDNLTQLNLKVSFYIGIYADYLSIVTNVTNCVV